MAIINGKEIFFSAKVTGRKAIIHCNALPTTDIDTTSFYELDGSIYWYDVEWHKLGEGEGSSGGVSSWNDLPDRPFYVNGDKEYISDTKSINIEGYFYGTNKLSGKAALVTSDVPKIDEQFKCPVKWKYTDNESSTAVVTENTSVLENYTVITGGYDFDSLVLIITDYESFNAEYGVTLPQNGVYLTSYEVDHTSGSKNYSNQTNAISVTLEEIVKIDNKFIDLPNNEAFKVLEAKIPTVPKNVSAFNNDAGYVTEKTVVNKISEVVANAPEDFDTLKEMSDWIASHSGSAAEMNSAITDNAVAIKALYENRPCYDDSIDISYSDAGVSVPLTNGNAYLQTGKVYSLSELLGATVVCQSASMVETVSLSESNLIEQTDDGLTFKVSNYNPIYIFVAYTTNYKPSVATITLPSVGIYFSYYDDGDTYLVHSLKTEDRIKKLDEKFIPDSIARVKDIPTGSGGSSQAIIDVTELPTENINTNAFYRIKEETVKVYSLIDGEENVFEGMPFTIHTVDTLPEIGELYVDESFTHFVGYFQTSDDKVYLYMPDEENDGATNIWVDLAVLDIPYAVVNSPSEAIEEGEVYFVKGIGYKSILYAYDGGWVEYVTKTQLEEAVANAGSNSGGKLYLHSIEISILKKSDTGTDTFSASINTYRMTDTQLELTPALLPLSMNASYMWMNSDVTEIYTAPVIRVGVLGDDETVRVVYFKEGMLPFWEFPLADLTIDRYTITEV